MRKSIHPYEEGMVVTDIITMMIGSKLSIRNA
jgi:hypothetical protein